MGYVNLLASTSILLSLKYVIVMIDFFSLFRMVLPLERLVIIKYFKMTYVSIILGFPSLNLLIERFGFKIGVVGQCPTKKD